MLQNLTYIQHWLFDAIDIMASPKLGVPTIADKNCVSQTGATVCKKISGQQSSQKEPKSPDKRLIYSYLVESGLPTAPVYLYPGLRCRPRDDLKDQNRTDMAGSIASSSDNSDADLRKSSEAISDLLNPPSFAPVSSMNWLKRAYFSFIHSLSEIFNRYLFGLRVNTAPSEDGPNSTHSEWNFLPLKWLIFTQETFVTDLVQAPLGMNSLLAPWHISQLGKNSFISPTIFVSWPCQ